MPPRIAKKTKPAYRLEYEVIDRKRMVAKKLADFNEKYSAKMRQLKEKNVSLDRLIKEMEKYRIAFAKLKAKLNTKLNKTKT